ATPDLPASAKAGSTPSFPCAITCTRRPAPARLAAARKPAFTASAACAYVGDCRGKTRAMASLPTTRMLGAGDRGRVSTAEAAEAGDARLGAGRIGAGTAGTGCGTGRTVAAG